MDRCKARTWLIAACVAGVASLDAEAGVHCFSKSSLAPNLVAAVQETLAKAGFSPGDADGAWGPRTERALAAFQRARRLQDTGALDGASLRALFGESATPEKYGLTPNPELPPQIFAKECK
jgi:peptidoglycan hydrolase-like protein with peptidoglycan-binding domain